MNHKQLLGVFIILIMVFSLIPLLNAQIMGSPAATTPTTTSPTTTSTTKIDPNLLSEMNNVNNGGTIDAVVLVNGPVNFAPIKFNHDAVVAALKAEAKLTQAPIISYLLKHNVTILNTFWIEDMILIRATPTALMNVAKLSGVTEVIQDFKVTIPTGQVQQINFTQSQGDATATWNIEKVNAPEVWSQLGLYGQGVKFATTDTGVDLTHADLKGTMFTANPSDPTYPGGWAEFDSNGNWVEGSVPHDTYGHGTATYGLIVGDNESASLGYPSVGAVGMAPKAIGMSALTLPGASGTFPEVIAGLEWILAPYDPDYPGVTWPMPAVSSHSWGASGYVTEMIAPCEALYYAGQTVFVAIGNTGEGSTECPGNIYQSVIGVGATDINDNVAYYSSGQLMYSSYYGSPAGWPTTYMKPEISAPGDNVIVPYPGNTYVYWSGTSFASPTAAGAAVLMLSGNPSLNPDQIRTALENTSVWYNTYYPSKPDDRYGWGRIDAYAAVVAVALPQGIVGKVTDAKTGLPLTGGTVTAIFANGTAGTFTTKTIANGTYDLRLPVGTYNVTFSDWGYYSSTANKVAVASKVFTTINAALTLIPPGFVAGYVYYNATGIGIPGALVQAVGTPRTVQALTNVNGFYNVSITPGTYTFQTSCYQFKTVTQTGVSVSSGVTTPLNFYLVQPPSVAVIGDYDNYITTFLSEQGYSVTQYNTFEAIMPYIPEYQTIVVNWPGYWETVPQDVFNSFVSATDAAGVGVVWLDQSYSYYQTGGWLLNEYLGWPYERFDYNYAYGADYTYYKVVNADSNLIPGYNVGDRITFDQSSTYKMYLYYYDYRPDGYITGVGTVKTVATVGYEYGGVYYDYDGYGGMYKVTRDSGAKWVLLSLHGNNYYIDTPNWTSQGAAIFLNSLAWTAAPQKPEAKFCVWNLTVTPAVGLWSQNRTVSVGIKDVGIGGTTTVQMDVNGILAGQTTVTLASGQWTYLTWTVSEFNIGTYTVTVRNLATTFTVRAPVVTVQAYQYNSNKPLAGATIYGYYRTYTPPGWQTQWSYTYGGYGHSQFAQPVMSLTGNGINQVIVGGYETTITPGYAHILQYNKTTGNYDNLYTWNSGGASPSGACPLPLGNGTTLLVMSWGYGSNPGIYAYRWNGKTLTQVAYYYSSFTYDVYSCDLLHNGNTEIICSNSPYEGGYVTPYHVFILGWNSATSNFVFEGGWYCPGDIYNIMECPMSWTGNIYGTNKTYIVSCVSYGYTYTAGVWALSWNGTALNGTQICTGASFTGMAYGVSIGYVKGDSIPEIGIGTCSYGYSGGYGYLLKYNTTTGVFDQVFSGAWPSEYAVIEGVAMGDVYNNGKTEFVVGATHLHIIGWTGTGYAEIGTITTTQGMISGVNVGNMDNSGKNELKACDILGYGPGDEWIFKYLATPMPSSTWTFGEIGTTNTNGTLTFNSPSSIADFYLTAYVDPSSGILCRHVKPSYQYLLTAYSYVAGDTAVTFSPTSKTVAQVVAKPDAPGLYMVPHQGIVWVQKQFSVGPLAGTWQPVLWPYTCNATTPTDIVITPEPYVFRHMLNEIDQFGSWWYYFMAPDQTATLKAGQTYSYTFAGPIKGSVKHTQIGTSVTISWSANDTEGHQITGITLSEVGWLASFSYTPVPIVPSLLNNVLTLVGQTSNMYPLISLYSKSCTLINSGYVTWNQKPATATVPAGVTVSYAELDFISGPYGNPYAKMYVTTIVECHK